MAEYTGLICTGVRYMDDQIAIAAYHKKDKLGKKLAIKFFNMLADCYDEKMIMENEATNISENHKTKKITLIIPIPLEAVTAHGGRPPADTAAGPAGRAGAVTERQIEKARNRGTQETVPVCILS